MALSDVMTLGHALAESKYFNDAKEASQAVVKVLAGQELGIGPIAAMSGLYVVKGKVVIGGNVMASLIKASPKYDYKIVEHSNENCTIEFFENGENIGASKFTAEDAKIAGLQGKDTYKAYPRNMFFNRAISNGARWFCPDLFNGQSVYTPGEVEESGIVTEEPALDLIIEPRSEPTTIDRQELIKDIMKSEDFPAKGSPAEKVEFINKQVESRGLDVETITVPEILNNGE
jgi:hypothetical protein